MEAVPMGIALGKARAEWAEAEGAQPAAAARELLPSPPPSPRDRARRVQSFIWLALLALFAGAHVDAFERLAASSYGLVHEGFTLAAGVLLALVAASMIHRELAARTDATLPGRRRARLLRRLGTALWIGAGALVQLALSM
jgi:small neutral amino acid transporter SnatA (MarC family)